MSAITGYNPATVSALTSGTYRHVALSISGTVHTLYLDGSMVAQNLTGGNVFASYTSAISNIFIGCAADLSYGLTGSIDDFKVWNRVLPPADISAIYLANPLFTPKNISGLILWLDAADAATFSGSTNAITWSDKSGYGHNATNTTATVGNYIKRTTAAGSSSYSTVEFKNNSTFKDQLITLKWTFTPTFVFPCTIFIVFDVAQLAGDWFLPLSNYYISSGGGGILNTLQLYIENASSNILKLGQAGGGIGNVGATYYLNRLNMVTIQIYNNGNTYYSLNNLNGTINTTYTVYSTSPYPILAQSWFMQMRSTNLSTVGISEYLIYNNNLLTQTQYQQVEGYLANKWGLQTSLPTTHPYYTQPPVGPIDSLSASAKTAMLGNGKQAGAYGVRVLYSGYTGPVMNLKRSTDNVTQDFYADATGNLGTAFLGKGTSITTWLGAATAYVMTWYDQTGNSNHGTATGSPLYDTTNKKVTFNGGYFSISDNAFPTGNLPYTYIYTPNDYTSPYSQCIHTGGSASPQQACITYLTSDTVINNSWWNDGSQLTIASGNKIAECYSGSGITRTWYLNGISYTPTTGGSTGNRNQTSIKNFIGFDNIANFNKYNGSFQFFYWAPIQLTVSDLTTLCNT